MQKKPIPLRISTADYYTWKLKSTRGNPCEQISQVEHLGSKIYDWPRSHPPVVYHIFIYSEHNPKFFCCDIFTDTTNYISGLSACNTTKTITEHFFFSCPLNEPHLWFIQYPTPCIASCWLLGLPVCGERALTTHSISYFPLFTFRWSILPAKGTSFVNFATATSSSAAASPISFSSITLWLWFLLH